jgi:hypothetical protein
LHVSDFLLFFCSFFVYLLLLLRIYIAPTPARAATAAMHRYNAIGVSSPVLTELLVLEFPEVPAGAGVAVGVAVTVSSGLL